MLQIRMRAASTRLIACAIIFAVFLCLPRTSPAQRGGAGFRGGHSGFSGSHFGGGTHLGGGTHFRPSTSFGGSIGFGGTHSGSFVGASIGSRFVRPGSFFHRPFHHHSGTSFFFGLSFGGYYPYYYDPFWYDPFWYPGYAYYPYPVYRTVYVDEPAYVERRYRDSDYRSGDDDYYLHRRYSSERPPEAVHDAVVDIEQAFLKGDCGLLERHIETKDTIRIYSRDRSTKPVKGSEYVDMTRDAMKDMKTVSYRLDRVQPAGGGAWSVSGVHVLKAENGDEKRFDVNFTMKKADGRWIIVEAGATAFR